MLNKYKMLDAKVLDTPMSTSARIDKDEASQEVNKSLDHFYIWQIADLTLCSV